MRFHSGSTAKRTLWSTQAALLTLLGVAVAWAGCRSTDDPEKAGRPNPASTKGGGLLRAEPESTDKTNTTPAASSAPSVLPASGRVHTLNPGLRFVVVDYTLGGMPPLHSRLNVYRNNEKIGEVRLSGPERNGFVAADILEGILQIGDEVRPQ